MSRWQGKRINEGCHCCSCTCAWRHLRQVHANLTRHEAAALVTTFRRGRADVTWMVDANFVCEMLCVTTCVIPFMPINVEHLRLLSWSFSYKVLQSTMVAGVWCGTKAPSPWALHRHLQCDSQHTHTMFTTGWVPGTKNGITARQTTHDLSLKCGAQGQCAKT